MLAQSNRRGWTRRQILRTWFGLTIGLTLAEACNPGGPPTLPAATSTSLATTTSTQPLSGQTARPTSKDGGRFTFSIWPSGPPSLDPYLNVSIATQEFAGFFYSRLLMSRKGPGIPAQAYELDGDLAESWKVDEDGKTYTFVLRTNARWHNRPPLNGRAVTAQDVVWSFQHFMRVSVQRSAFDIVADVIASDARTVRFRLKDTFAAFEALIGSPIFWILPREIIEQDGDATKRVVGSGPFMFDRLDRGISLRGVKNPDYYRASEPHVDEIIGLIIPDDATAMAALRAHELDFYQVAQPNVEPLKRSNPEIQYVEWEYVLMPLFYWKIDKPPFNDVRVRQAVSMAANRQEMIDVADARRGNWNNFIPWALSGWWLDPRGSDQGPTAKYFKYDPAEAKRLLAAAGYPDGLQLTLISTPDYGAAFVQRLELAQQHLKAIGILTDIRTQDYSTYISTTYRGQFEGTNTLVFGLAAPFTEPHDFLYHMFHPSGTRNNLSVNDARLSSLIDQQSRTLDRAVRKQQVFEIQRYLAEQMYCVPYGAGMRTAGLSPSVRDFFPRSDFGVGAEVVPKVWMDRA